MKTSKSATSQTVVDFTDFESDMGGWEFKFWMPPGRNASAKIIDGIGYISQHCLQIDADGRDDDGIFFSTKAIKGRY